ncbi:MAG: hypothetical protein ACE5Q6_04200 [Dehalococcoidia bacterium]
MGLATLTLAMACSFIGGDSGSGTESSPAPAPTGASTPAQKAKPTPEPTAVGGIERRWTGVSNTASAPPSVFSASSLQPTPVAAAATADYIRTPAQAEEIAWHEIRACADQLNAALEDPVLVGFDSTFSSDQGLWSIDAFSIDPSLSFGNWLVIDTTGEIIANDALAQEISTPGNTCALPESELATGRTAPKVGEPISISDPFLAAASVWDTVYGCFGDLPEFSRLPATRDGATTWVVGRSADSLYGQWSLDAITGEVSPLTTAAQEAEGLCLNSLSAVTDTRAALRVWLATYECFTPSPDLEDYKTFQENSSQWIVEAKHVVAATEFNAEISISYGLWTVEVATGEIQPWDKLASDTAEKTCFKTLD